MCSTPFSQIWISFLELSFSGKWVGFLILFLQGSTSAWIADVPTKPPLLSFDAREFLLHCQKNNVKSPQCIGPETRETLYHTAHNLQRNSVVRIRCQLKTYWFRIYWFSDYNRNFQPCTWQRYICFLLLRAVVDDHARMEHIFKNIDIFF